jgi:hypothetical protein
VPSTSPRAPAGCRPASTPSATRPHAVGRLRGRRREVGPTCCARPAPHRARRVPHRSTPSQMAPRPGGQRQPPSTPVGGPAGCTRRAWVGAHPRLDPLAALAAAGVPLAFARTRR